MTTTTLDQPTETTETTTPDTLTEETPTPGPEQALRNRLAALPDHWPTDDLTAGLLTAGQVTRWATQTTQTATAARQALTVAVAQAATAGTDPATLHDLSDALHRAETIARAAAAVPIPDVTAAAQEARTAAARDIAQAIAEATLTEPSYLRERAAWRGLAPHLRDRIEPPAVTPADQVAAKQYEALTDAGQEWGRREQAWRALPADADPVGVLESAAALIDQAHDLTTQARAHARAVAAADAARRAAGIVWTSEAVKVEPAGEPRPLTRRAL